jgi:HSP20 family molecular chaperone IbpA
MGLVKYMAKEFFKEIDNKSREFFEFVLPPIDLHQEGNNFIVTVDIPGFNKNDISVTMNGNVLSIKAEKKEETKGRMVMKQRPLSIDKKIKLPITVKEGQEKVDSAKYTNGVLTIKIPNLKKGKKISVN